MTEQELIEMILDQTNAYVSLPFNKPNRPDQIKWYVLKHHHNDKILAMVYTKDQELSLNLKLQPELNAELQLLKGVLPGYHMNKRHWVTIIVNNTELSRDELLKAVAMSADLTS